MRWHKIHDVVLLGKFNEILASFKSNVFLRRPVALSTTAAGCLAFYSFLPTMCIGVFLALLSKRVPKRLCYFCNYYTM